MRVPFVDLSEQFKAIKPVIDKAINEVFTNSVYIGGEPVEALEKTLANLTKRDFCVTCANGTDGLEIALEALGISAGDEVLVPALSWISTASAVVRVGAKPVFVDIDPDYYTIDPVDARSKITAKTKAIVPVHLYGLPAQMELILSIAEEYNLFIIEDCAQAIGASINKNPVGSMGDLAVFSFYPSKNLGAYGDAGALMVSTADLAEQCRTLTSLGLQGKHRHVLIGRNSRLDTIQAAIIQAKIPFLEEWTAKRRRVARLYNNYFADMAVKTPRIPTNFKHVFHAYVIQVENRDQLREYLDNQGVVTQIHYPQALPDLEVFPGAVHCPVATEITSKIVSLPMYPELSDEQIQYVVELVKNFTKGS